MKSAYASARGQGRATWLGVLHCVLLTCCAVFMHRENLCAVAVLREKLLLLLVVRVRRPSSAAPTETPEP